MRHTTKSKENKKDTETAAKKCGSQTRHTRLPGPEFGIFDPKVKKYVRATANRWPVGDEIKWIESCLSERKALEDPKLTEDEKHYLGLSKTLQEYRRNPPSSPDLEIWLQKVRDQKSWNAIAQEHHLTYNKYPEAARSSARRAYERVEKYLVKGEGKKRGNCKTILGNL